VTTFLKETNEWIRGDELDMHKQRQASDKVWIFVE